MKNGTIASDLRELFMYTGSVSFPNGKPTVMDVAISLAREGRYCGAGMRFWPVGLHTLAVCDLLPDRLKLHGWMHDASECITGDIPKPVKVRFPEVIEQLEEELTRMIYAAWGLPYPSESEQREVKEVDRMVLRGEVYTVGTQALQTIYERCPQAEEIVMKYVQMYDYNDMLDAGGRVPVELMRRFRLYKDLFYIPSL